MAKIKVTSKCALYDGMSITFKAPCDGTAVDGLNVYYNNVAQSFTLRDAHGNNLANLDNLFSEGAYIKAILDTGNGYAYLQNADSSGYLEAHLDRFGNSLGNEYVWEVTTTLYEESRTNATYCSLYGSTSGSTVLQTTIYCDAITIDETGIIHGVDATEYTGTYQDYANDSSLFLGKYIYLADDRAASSMDGSDTYPNWYYIPSDAYVHSSSSGNAAWVSLGSINNDYPEMITSVAKPGTKVGFVNSPDSTAYPPVLGTEYVLDTPSYSAVQIAMVVTDSFTVNYYDSIEIGQTDGSISYSGTLQSVSATYNTRTNLSTLAGKYVLLDDTIYYCNPESPYSVTENTWYYFYLNLWPVSTISQDIHDEYTYNLRGQIGGAAQMVTGSYTGTGTYGSSNPNSLTFDFAPKIVWIGFYKANNIYNGDFLMLSIPTSSLDFSTPIFFTDSLVPGSYIGYGSNFYQKITKSTDGKTISWYSTQNASGQSNDSGYEYFYIAIG